MESLRAAAAVVHHGHGMTTVRRAWPHGRRGSGLAWLPVLAAGLLAATLTACTALVSAPGGSGRPTGTDGKPGDRIHQQAHDALERWARAVAESGGAAITFTGELTSQIGEWEAAVGDNNKVALMAGKVESMIDLPDDPPNRGEVKWLDGTTQGVDVLSAAAALEDLVAGGADCGDCEPTALRVTEATLATSLVETSRGPANAPTWVFTIAGSDVRITRVAVDDRVTVDPPPWDAENPPVGIRIERAAGSAGSRELEVVFVGAAGGRDKPCGADYATEAVESDLAVVIIVIEDRNPTPAACPLVGALRTATVELAEVLGSRAVLEVTQGLPVPLEAPEAG